MSEKPFSLVTNLRKTGKLQEAWNLGFSELEKNPNDSYLKGALFWVCHAYLKENQSKIAQRAKSSGNFKPTDFEFEQIERLLQTIMQLGIKTGGMEYKNLLIQFKKNGECFPTWIHCILKHQDTLFDAESKDPFQVEKGEVPSLMLSSARHTAKAWINAAELWQLDLNLVLEFITKTRVEVKDTQHLIWLEYDQAKCLIITGQLLEARKLIIPILKKKQSESWAWGALAATYRQEDSDIAIELFSKGISCAHEVSFSLKLLKGIIPLLVAKQQTKEASMCLKRIVNTYYSNDWKLKKDIEQLVLQPWYDNTVNENNLDTFVKSASYKALDYLHGETHLVVGLVKNIHKSGKGFHVFINKETSVSVRISIHQSKKKPLVGDYVELSVTKEESGELFPVKSTPCQPSEIQGVSTIQGELRLAPKGFGFVENTFIPPFLIDSIKNSSIVSVLSITTWDKTKSRYGQKAIKIEQIKS